MHAKYTAQDAKTYLESWHQWRAGFMGHWTAYSNAL